MADVSIPSPSVFLRKTPPPAPPLPPTHNARRATPTQAKKKAPRRQPVVDTTAGILEGSSVAKPKQSKSRNGCVTCKAKRLKCDEEKPTCQQCARRNVPCGGYRKDFKWRPFEDSNVKINIDRQKRGPSPPNGTSTNPTPTGIKPGKAPGETSAPGGSPADDAATARSDSPRSHGRASKPPDTSGLMLPERIKTQPIPPSGSVTPSDELPDPASLSLTDDIASVIPMDLMPPVTMADFEFNPDVLGPGALSQFAPGLGLSPTLTGSLWPYNADDPMHQDFVNYELPEVFQTPRFDPHPMSPTLAAAALDMAFLENDMAFDMPLSMGLTMPPTSGLPTPTSSSLAESPDGLHPALAYIYPQPQYENDGREVLTWRFAELTCGVLSIVDGPGENPWRDLLWPLVQHSPALYHAINAMAAFHSAFDLPQLRIVGHEHKAASIRYCREGIRDNSFSLLTAIATCLALAFAEAWDQHICTGITHIKGAQELVKHALAAHRKERFNDEDLARLKFLCNAWVYMDVISRLTSVESNESEDFDNTYLFSGNPNDSPALIPGTSDASSGFGIDFGMPIDTRLDPLMGCAGTLFPLIGRVANLVRKVCRSQANSPAIISQAHDIKIALETWDPPTDIEPPSDPTTTIEHTLQTAEAYRWATLLHLHSAVPELPSLTSTELAQRVLQYVATVPLTSRAVIVHVFPLLIAGCEAKLDEDRTWIMSRFASMNNRMRLGVVDKASAVVQEVWSRRDLYEAQPSTNRKLVPTTDLKSERHGSRPFVKSPKGTIALGGDPGHTGMVFSYVGDTNENGTSDPLETDKETQKKLRARQRRVGKDPRMGELQDIAYTVRGHLHWIGVMWDWKWEILMG
ncbi:fungal-specific transcription factor domain-containing protein [Neohortaea acidophila]|uniref:Fungal-specific transcription factor domain-containing protein n=1 Tax=Neohortaea acidophila TaxID=245834 RepID=A0A6A6PHM0_9PEZI|nr:fungal-specific transcription factor domain-containing protein [Neohortaea acidophila]KAF2479518.1 fungal-specific transcription factor domain-containing protein [Neohortaea acidophila]